MNVERAANFLKQKIRPENILINEPMRNHTSFRIGGPADMLVLPESIEEVGFVVNVCSGEGFPCYIIGNGTNLLVRDGGIRGIVVKTSKHLKNYEVNGNIITAEAGISLAKLADIALQHGLEGLEFASGIPGTLGGAVVMNAGAYGSEMKDVVVETEYLGCDRAIAKVVGAEHEFGYRKSIFQHNGGVVLKTAIGLAEGDRGKIRDLMNDFNSRRKEKQPLNLPSAGSVFKRPEGFYAGRLIEDSGLKGYRIGGAEVSTLHSGFIVNSAGASAADVINLIELIQCTVKDKFGVDLQTEIKIIGEE